MSDPKNPIAATLLADCVDILADFPMNRKHARYFAKKIIDRVVEAAGLTCATGGYRCPQAVIDRVLALSPRGES